MESRITPVYHIDSYSDPRYPQFEPKYQVPRALQVVDGIAVSIWAPEECARDQKSSSPLMGISSLSQVCQGGDKSSKVQGVATV